MKQVEWSLSKDFDGDIISGTLCRRGKSGILESEAGDRIELAELKQVRSGCDYVGTPTRNGFNPVLGGGSPQVFIVVTEK